MTPSALGDYVAEGILAHGRFGDVVRARHPGEPRDVALVLVELPPGAPADVEARFVDAMRRVAAVRHPALLAIEDAGVADGQPYLVTEVVEGGTLQDRIAALRARGAAMPLEEAVGVVAWVAAGLDAAHAAGIAHGDLVAASILLRRTGEPVVADVGLAVLLGSPEEGAGRVSAGASGSDAAAVAAGDRRALARLFLEMTCAPAHARPTGAVPSGAGLPAAVRAVLATALDPDPGGGYATAADLVTALSRAGQPPGVPAVPGTPPPVAVGVSAPAAAPPAAATAAPPAAATAEMPAPARRRVSGRVAAGVATAGLVVLAGLLATTQGWIGGASRPSASAPAGGATATPASTAAPGDASPSLATPSSGAATPSHVPGVGSLSSCPATTGTAVLRDAFANPTDAIVETGRSFTTTALPEPLATRYAVEARVSIVSASEATASGIVFGGLGDADRFELLVRGTGDFRLVRRVGGTASDLVPWTASDRLGAGSPAWIGVVVRAAEVTVCINGSIVAALEEPALRPGRAGMTVEAIGGPAEIRFEDFAVLQLP